MCSPFNYGERAAVSFASMVKAGAVSHAPRGCLFCPLSRRILRSELVIDINASGPDAAAIGEAVTPPSMHFVLVKSVEQQSALMLRRTRELLIRQRIINALCPLGRTRTVAVNKRITQAHRANADSKGLSPFRGLA